VELECFPSSVVPHSSRLFLDYTESARPLAPFYSNAAVSRNWFREGRQLSAEHRARLADLLDVQNAQFGGGGAAATNIQRLRNGASAVVTGPRLRSPGRARRRRPASTPCRFSGWQARTTTSPRSRR
jgi:hypothetical protein